MWGRWSLARIGQTFQRRNELRGHEFSGLGCVWVDLFKPVGGGMGGGMGGGGPCLARTPRPPFTLVSGLRLGRVGWVTPGTGGGGAGWLPWEPSQLWVSSSEDALEGNELTPPARW